MPYFSIACGDGLRVEYAILGQRLQRRDGDEAPINLEMLAQRLARVTATVAVRAERINVPGTQRWIWSATIFM